MFEAERPSLVPYAGRFDGFHAIPATVSKTRTPQEALGEGVHSVDVILDILARRRDPGPPLTIATPETLRLHCEPAADCARYDSLTRNS